MSPFQDLIQHNIRAYGQHLVGVRGQEPGDIESCYSVGNHQFNLPELIFVGLSPRMVSDSLNTLCLIQRQRGVAFRDGELVNVGARYPVRIRDAGTAALESFAREAKNYYESADIRLMQAILCDRQGRYPDESYCDDPFRWQPILGMIRH